jgi:hypothetical protein
MCRPEEIKDQLKIIEISKQTQTIKSLNVRARLLRLDGKAFIPALLSLARNMPNLVLKQSVFVDILQDLPNLEKFKIDSFDIEDGYDDDLDSRVIVKESKIKQLHVGAYSEEVENMDQINNILKLILQSCPALQRFTFSGEFACKAPDATKLHFLSHLQLKYIKIDLENNDHYTFSKVQAKKEKMAGL